jgi:hypothetical protein
MYEEGAIDARQERRVRSRVAEASVYQSELQIQSSRLDLANQRSATDPDTRNSELFYGNCYA